MWVFGMRIKFEDWDECKKIMQAIALNLEDEFVDIDWNQRKFVWMLDERMDPSIFNGVEQFIKMINLTDTLPHSDEIKIRKIVTNLRFVAGMYDITGYNYKAWLSEKVNDVREMYEYYDVK